MPNAFSLKMLNTIQKILPANISDMYLRLLFGKTKPKNIIKFTITLKVGIANTVVSPKIFSCEKVKKFFNDISLTTVSLTIYSEQS